MKVISPPLAIYSEYAQTILAKIPYPLPFTAQILQKQHVSEVTKIFIEAFCDYEPMTKHVNMTYQEFEPFAHCLTTKAAQDGLSIIALDGNKIVACALVEDILNPPHFNFPLTDKFIPIFSLLEHINSSFFEKKSFKEKYIAHLAITAVDPAFHRKNLSSFVNFHAMALAIHHGFKFMVSELTNYYNEAGIMHHLNFNKMRSGYQSYTDYKLKENHPFKGLAGSAACYLWALYSDIELEYKAQ